MQQYSLRTGNTSSCGCYKAEMTRISNIKLKTTHGYHKTPTYLSWHAMKNRCLNPRAHAYEKYGGAGIVICERWLKFENFLEDMGIRPAGRTLDRIDNDGNYEPGNCRWATRSQQSKNRKPFPVGKPLAKELR